MVFESQYNVGDVIEVNGFLGTVTDIALRTTSITDFGGNIKIMNNSDVRNILNRSNEDSKAICDVGIAYEEDIEHVEEVLDKVLIATEKKYPAIFPEKPQYIGVQELGESSVTLRILAKVAEKDVFAARRILNREIKIGFEKENIFIPFPQLVVTEKK